MQSLTKFAGRFANDTRGATSIEYGLIATLIAVGAIGGMQALGGGISGSWGTTAQKVTDAMKTSGP
jgi:pilus assembly protein Flp/PilA